MDRIRPARGIGRADGVCLLKKLVRAGTIVLVGIGSQHAAQMRLAVGAVPIQRSTTALS